MEDLQNRTSYYLLNDSDMVFSMLSDCFSVLEQNPNVDISPAQRACFREYRRETINQMGVIIRQVVTTE